MPHVRFRALLPMLALALTGCGPGIAGEPIPAAGFQDEPRSTTRAPADEPQIPRPRDAARADPCALLQPEALAALGGPVGRPHRGDPVPGACAQRLGSAPEDTAAAGFYAPYEAVVDRQPRGVAVAVEGHSSWLYCEEITEHQTCTAATAIAPDRTLLTMLSLRGASAADTSDPLFRLTRTALGALPPA
ncbi:DUF3558 family protein [Saccharopolyspora griseoalba]|uniref:DUF3558 family protein n=1 Tax=Saccharopolyspora griseoalba TaxID=1431848 RepID=A0ABW2LLM9_9PSEU